MKSRAFVALATVLLSHNTFAGKAPPPPPPAPGTTTIIPTDQTRNRVYAGLKWDLPGSLTPELVLAIRRAKTESDSNDTHGADLSMSFAIFQGFKPGKLRLKVFTGNRTVQGELGGGFDFANNAFFLGPSVNVPFANLGVDWSFGGGLQPYGMIHSHGKPRKPQPITRTTAVAPAPPPPPPPPPPDDGDDGGSDD